MHRKQQDRPRTAALSISVGNSELEPDERPNKTHRSLNRQSIGGRQIGGRAALFTGCL